MADAIATLRQQLQDDLDDTRAQIRELMDKITRGDPDVMATTVDGLRSMGEIRSKTLRERENSLIEQLARLPFSESYPLAVGTNAIGSNLDITPLDEA